MYRQKRSRSGSVKMKAHIVSILVMLGMTTHIAIAQQEVVLNDTLFLGEYARPGQMVTFTCEARDTTVLEWHSEEYIGSGGDIIEILSNGHGNNQTRLGGDTVATRVSVSTVSGITVIISQLHIMTSEQIPTSSVTCATNGNGPRKVIPFTTTAMSLQEVMLSSTLYLGEYARPGQRVTFTCEARDATVLEWSGEDYIGSGGDRIEILNSGRGNNQTRLGGNTTASRVSVNTYSGVTVIVSQLHIMTSERFPTSSVTCAINDQGPRKVISFTTTDSIPEVTSTSESSIITSVSDNPFRTTAEQDDDNNDGLIAGVIFSAILTVTLVVISIIIVIILLTYIRCKSKAHDGTMPQKEIMENEIHFRSADMVYKIAESETVRDHANNAQKTSFERLAGQREQKDLLNTGSSFLRLRKFWRSTFDPAFRW